MINLDHHPTRTVALALSGWWLSCWGNVVSSQKIQEYQTSSIGFNRITIPARLTKKWFHPAPPAMLRKDAGNTIPPYPN